MKTKKIALLMAAALSALMVFTGCQSSTTGGSDETATTYKDGIYRGAYIDGSVQVEFSMKDNKFTELTYRKMTYKGEDYLAEGISDVYQQIVDQYNQLAESIIGKDVSALDAFYTPETVVSDTDAVTGATLRATKVSSAIWDGLNRQPYKLGE